MPFAITPAAGPVEQGLPGDWVQFQKDGANVGEPDVAALDVRGAQVVVTRGVGENAHVVTIRMTPTPGGGGGGGEECQPLFLDRFDGPAGMFVAAHDPDIAPDDFQWEMNQGNSLLDGAGNVRPETPGQTVFREQSFTPLQVGTTWRVKFVMTMPG